MAGPLKNLKHEAFARALARGLDTSEAFEEAGYRPNPGNARRLKLNEAVQARVAELTEPAVRATIRDVQALYDHILAQGTFDPTIFDGVNSLEDLGSKVPEEYRRLLVKGWHYDKSGRFVLDLVDKDKALERLARHLSFFNDTVKVEVVGFDAALEAAERKLGLGSGASK